MHITQIIDIPAMKAVYNITSLDIFKPWTKEVLLYQIVSYGLLAVRVTLFYQYSTVCTGTGTRYIKQ